MTSIQQRKVDMIKRQAENLWGSHSDKYEVKTFDVEEHEYFVSVFAEVGMIGDEGTMAQYIGRDRVQVFIGPRGGMRVPVHKQMKNGEWKHFYKPYTTFLSASIDQR